MTDYESVRLLIESLPRAESSGVRDVKWVTPSKRIGVARDPEGRVEVFIVGKELTPQAKSVRDVVKFRSVHRDGKPSLEANQLVLPALGHFDQVAAFVCTELNRNGADRSIERAFALTEPIIELAIERLRLSTETLVGLAGELLLLEALCRRAAKDQVTQVIDSWHGWKRSSRDFAINSTGVEVKTTTGSTSSHLVEGVHQVERNDGAGGGDAEDRFLLVSIGLEAGSAEGNVFSIPFLVERVVEQMTEAGMSEAAVDRFLSRVADYGSEAGGGYAHRSESSPAAYATSFHTTFFRAYDMSDNAVQVLRRSDVVAHSHVDVGSVRFRIDLPTAVSASNPVTGANRVARAILGVP